MPSDYDELVSVFQTMSRSVRRDRVSEYYQNDLEQARIGLSVLRQFREGHRGQLSFGYVDRLEALERALLHWKRSAVSEEGLAAARERVGQSVDEVLSSEPWMTAEERAERGACLAPVRREVSREVRRERLKHLGMVSAMLAGVGALVWTVRWLRRARSTPAPAA